MDIGGWTEAVEYQQMIQLIASAFGQGSLIFRASFFGTAPM